MKYLKFVTVTLAVTIVSLSCMQSTNAESEVETTVSSLYDAMVTKDEAKMKQILAEKLSYGHSSGTIENKQEFIEAVMHGSFDYLSITPENQYIVLSGDVALVRHLFITEALSNGEPTHVKIGNLMTFQKKNGSWKLLGRQAYKLP